ncbi:TIGR01777 family oxidoreductase [Occallatibacter riparius]|uniref:TIGR01777 family oxidoreductase n=1 Tax=Occallatibacter riparius TaxID=1002689 RepID=A0A9J7BRW1_9BACT|nr:TIGR01777 family oxidoreductase [Occallatibacter riparius]UWZ83662.1 TIGR01777 family oxidoreductase [Occallatibacter riparius]
MLHTRPLRIVIPGGSGQVGRLLASHFQERGHHVVVLTRSPFADTYNTVHWDGEHEGQWIEHLEHADVCINLAGRSVNCRYTAENRKAIYDSRIDTTNLLGRVISTLADPPALWLNASTATIYRHSYDKPMDEFTGEIGGHQMLKEISDDSDPWNFSIKVAMDWESAFLSAWTPRTRKIALRSAVVMRAAPGNPFSIYLNLVRLSLGGTQGNGRQYVSWIHEVDFARAVEFLIARDDIDGIVNVASPHPLPNREFMAALREAYGMPNGIPAPAPILEIAAFFHRTETELLLKSRRVIPARLLAAGFDFEFPYWHGAAEDLVRRWRERR